MNSTIRQLYTFKKKVKSFDKFFGERFVKCQLDALQPIEPVRLDFSNLDDTLAGGEDPPLVDLDTLEVEEEVAPMQGKRVKTVEEPVEDETYGLIYRVRKSQIVACKVPRRSYKVKQEELEALEREGLAYPQMSALERLAPLHEKYAAIRWKVVGGG